PREGPADQASSARRAVEALLHHLLGDAEAAGDLPLREALEEVRLDDLALLVRERRRDRGADRVSTLIGARREVNALLPEGAGVGQPVEIGAEDLAARAVSGP